MEEASDLVGHHAAVDQVGQVDGGQDVLPDRHRRTEAQPEPDRVQAVPVAEGERHRRVGVVERTRRASPTRRGTGSPRPAPRRCRPRAGAARGGRRRTAPSPSRSRRSRCSRRREGAGRSTGQFDQGIGEKEDATAAIRWLEGKYPGLPMALIGYSFGAWVGLQVAHSDPRVVAMVGLGLPLNLYDLEFLTHSPKPALYIVGTRDEFCSQENLDRFERRLPSSASVRRIENADHFFSEQADIVQGLISDFFLRLPPRNISL